jgi:hypothetical protein
MTNVASPMVRESVPLISVETVFKSPDATLFRIFSTDSFAIHVPPISNSKMILDTGKGQHHISYLYECPRKPPESGKIQLPR